MRIAFSTIASPQLDASGIREAVEAYGFDGVELYALGGQLLYPDALEPELPRLRGLPIVCVNSFATLVDGEAGQLVRALELAHQLESPLVKAFGGEGDDREMKLMRAAETLERALPRATALGVTVLVETHDGFSRGSDLAALLAATHSERTGALWDIQNSVAAGESLADTDEQIGERVLHVHVKDAVRDGDHWRPVELGDGELPVPELIERLHARGYDRYVSYDHEKYWHAELAEPAQALPQAATLLRDLIAKVVDVVAR